MKFTRFDERPFLILCEGEGDKRFLHKLIEARVVPDEFQIRFPDRGDTGTGGRDKFGPWLGDVSAVSEEFQQNIKAILVISDNDETPTDSFREVQDSLRKSGGFPIPATERTVARAKDMPPLVIFMLPDGGPGNLETLCVAAALEKWPEVQRPLGDFIKGTPAAKWKLGKQDKMRLQAIIAATCEDRPESGFVGHWHEREQFHIPLDHHTFDEIDKFLRGFRKMVGL